MAALFPKSAPPVQFGPKKVKRKPSYPFSKATIKHLRKAARDAKVPVQVEFIPPATWRLKSKDRTVHVKSLKSGLYEINNWFRYRYTF